MFIISEVFTGSSAGASALGSGPRGRRFKSSLPDTWTSSTGMRFFLFMLSLAYEIND